MILDEVRAILSTYFMTVWDATDISWPNEKPLGLQGEAWIRFSLVPYAWTVPIAPAPSRRRILSGDIVLQIFVPSGNGVGLATQLADEAATSFSLFSDENVFCYEAREPVIRGDDGHGWYQIDVAIPFRANPTPV
jgi:hypothetical protein